MLRSFHKFPGLIAALLIVIMAFSGAVMAFSGAVLSVWPAWEVAMAPALPDRALTVATLADRVAAAYPG
jgi:sulfite reductase (NADPH) flavoprotein alpha-component